MGKYDYNNGNWPSDPFNCLRAGPSLPTTPICRSEGKSDAAEEARGFCLKQQEKYVRYLKRNPEKISGGGRFLDLNCVVTNLQKLDDKIAEDDPKMLPSWYAYYRQNTLECFNWLYENEEQNLKDNIETAETVARWAKAGEKASLYFNIGLATFGIGSYFFGSGAVATETVLTTTAATGSMTMAEATPVLSATLYTTHRLWPRVQTLASSTLTRTGQLLGAFETRVDKIVTPVEKFVGTNFNRFLDGCGWTIDRTFGRTGGLISPVTNYLTPKIERVTTPIANFLGPKITGLTSWYLNSIVPRVNAVTDPVARFVGPKIDRVTFPVSNYVTRVANTSTPWLQWLDKHNLIAKKDLFEHATITGLAKSLMILNATLNTIKIVYHAGDEPDSEIAKLPGEEIFGRESRPVLGGLGAASIAYLYGHRLFNFTPLGATVFTIAHVFSEYRTQHNSNGVSFADMDWMRVLGGEISALLTYGPMNLLWKGPKGLKLKDGTKNALDTQKPGVWPGWLYKYDKRKSIFGVALPKEIPSFRAVTGLVVSSGAVNSALFVPISLWLERANLKNFWEGLTLREFTLSVPRKAKQAMLDPTSIPGILLYHASKVVENEIISRYFSLFAGTGLYRKPMHDILIGNTSQEEFAEHSMKSLGSCPINTFPNPFCESSVLEKEDYALVAKDIVNGEFSESELNKLTTYVEKILTDCSDSKKYRMGLAWLAAFNRVRVNIKNKNVLRLLDRHGAKIGGLTKENVREQIEKINGGKLDDTCTPETENPPALPNGKNRGVSKSFKDLTKEIIRPYQTIISLAVLLSGGR